MEIIDIHHHTEAEARRFLIREIQKGGLEFRIIHGHNRGIVLRDFIRNGRLETALKARGLAKRIILIDTSDSGATDIEIIPDGSDSGLTMGDFL